MTSSSDDATAAITALEYVRDAVLISDDNGRIVRVNAAFEKNVGQTARELTGQDAATLFQPDGGGAPFTERAWDFVRRGHSWSGECFLLKPNAQPLPVAARMKPIQRNGSLTHVLVIIHTAPHADASSSEAAKLREELQHNQRLALVGRMSRGVAHDFNNVLMGILGLVDFVGEAVEDNEEASEDVADIRKAIDRGADLTRQLLAFSQDAHMEQREIDAGMFIYNHARMVKRLLRRGVSLETAFPDNLWPIRFDPSQLSQVILNLVLNAQDAMPNGGRIRLKAQNIDADEAFCQFLPGIEPGQFLCVSITDTGNGIPSNKLSKVFAPFYSALEPPTRTGLAQVWEVVTEGGGTISVFSEVEFGTTYKVYLPAIAKIQPSLLEALRPDTELHILVVENDPTLRKLLERILHREGYLTTLFAHAGEALNIHADALAKADVLLTDLIMPQSRGDALFEALQERHSKLRVVYMCGHAGELVEHIDSNDADLELVEKPFRMDALMRAIRRTMRTTETP